MATVNRIAALALLSGILSAMEGRSQPILLAPGSDGAVVKWAAMGSGCRAVEDQPAKDGDVSLRLVPGNQLGKSPLLFELQMSHFHLKSGRQVDRGQVFDFYSECALRFAIRGQAGLRVKRMESLVKMDLHKEKGSGLLFFNELKFGQFGGDEKRLEADEQEEIKGRGIEVRLAKELSLLRGDGQSSCGTDQVLFYDFTLAAKNVDRLRPLTVSLAAPYKARIRLEFESC